MPSLSYARQLLFARLAVAGLVGSLLACGGGGGDSAATAPALDPPPAAPQTPAMPPVAPPASTTPPAAPQEPATPPAAVAASVEVTLEVPASLAAAPFDVARKLTVPPGFGMRLWARIPGARFMALAPNGDILVSHPESGKVYLLRERAGDVPQSLEFASGLQKPHDMVFHTIGSTTYLYIAESQQVTRSEYRNGDTQTRTREVVVADLPDASNTELQGSYSHELKNIALSPDNHLYVSIASSCNACVEDTESDPLRGAIYEYAADGSNPRLYAQGLRNAEGLDFIPGTSVLWVAVNNRDEIPYPFDSDFDGDGVSDLGKVMPGFVDDNPPEPFTLVRDGGNYGWPFCNSLVNATMSDLELVNDFNLNPDGTSFDCTTGDRASKGLRAHSAPLGLSFLHDSAVTESYRNGAAIALHGCWNCTSLRAGYKVVYFPFDTAGNAGNEIDLISGFVTDPDARTVWGRPVDVIADTKGNLLVSDDYAGAIYQLYPK